MKLIKFFSKQWFGVLLIIVLILIQINSDQQISTYKQQLKDLRIKIDKYELLQEEFNFKIDSLSSLEKEVVKEIQTIKEKEYVQVKVVDSMPISELQKFFSDRYPSDNSN